jgi:hypothetical protein
MYYLRYANFLILIIGITLYGFFMIVDYKDFNYMYRTSEKNMWILLYMVFLIVALLLVRYRYI